MPGQYYGKPDPPAWWKDKNQKAHQEAWVKGLQHYIDKDKSDVELMVFDEDTLEDMMADIAKQDPRLEGFRFKWFKPAEFPGLKALYDTIEAKVAAIKAEAKKLREIDEAATKANAKTNKRTRLQMQQDQDAKKQDIIVENSSNSSNEQDSDSQKNDAAGNSKGKPKATANKGVRSPAAGTPAKNQQEQQPKQISSASGMQSKLSGDADGKLKI